MARSFNGSSDYIVSASAKNSVALTIAGWVNESSRVNGAGNGANGHVLWSANIVSGGNFNEISSDNGTLLIAYNNFGWNSTSTTLPLATWSHVVTTADASNYFVYFNGSQVYTIADTGGTEQLSPIVIGAWSSGAGSVAPASGFFSGSIADVAIWNIRLTAAEISSLAKGARPNTIRPISLISWWPLDGLQSPEPDLSGNVNNGTLTGTTKASGPPLMMFTPRTPQFLALAPASTVNFRRTLSGTRAGSRQAII